MENRFTKPLDNPNPIVILRGFSPEESLLSTNDSLTESLERQLFCHVYSEAKNLCGLC
ncbi:hypothetical protein [Helicobacter marmotae]|uniref:hypothetical protein n=1 Tax=Helicobacter marmotae TaxID=152490 RepID=UPI0014766758|nr:hypothetical protein [Helicobacter marmotae]